MNSGLAFGACLILSSLLLLIIFSPLPGLSPSPTALLPPSQSPANSQFSFTINLISQSTHLMAPRWWEQVHATSLASAKGLCALFFPSLGQLTIFRQSPVGLLFVYFILLYLC